MEERLLRFVGFLRDSGIRVSPGEVVDCLKALKHFGVSKRQRFYSLLKATLVKSETDRGLFDLAFRLYFQEQVPQPPALVPAPPCAQDVTGVDGSGTGKAGMGAASRQLYNAIKNRQSAVLLHLVHQQLNFLQCDQENVDHLLHRIKVKMEWFMVENAFRREGRAGEEDAGILRDIEEYLRRNIEKKVINKKGEKGLSELLEGENLRKKDFSALNEAQVKEMEKRVDRLAHKLASRYSYRLKPAKSGRVDIRRVLQKAARLGRTPEKLLYHSKMLDKPRLVVMCDISGSVAVYSTFLLQLVYAMSRRFDDIRTFLFVDEIVEATPEFKLPSVSEAVRLAVAEARCSRLGISNFGQVFEIFHHEYGEILTPKTTLVILGDAKNNWYPPRQEELHLISQKVRKIIWLNPEPRNSWNKDDSIIDVYARSCSAVFECRNLEQLERAVRQIV